MLHISSLIFRNQSEIRQKIGGNIGSLFGDQNNNHPSIPPTNTPVFAIGALVNPATAALEDVAAAVAKIDEDCDTSEGMCVVVEITDEDVTTMTLLPLLLIETGAPVVEVMPIVDVSCVKELCIGSEGAGTLLKFSGKGPALGAGDNGCK